MSVAKFLVVLDKLEKIYYPGEMLTGRVKLVLNYPTKFKGVVLELKFKGKANCKWNETKTYFENKFKPNTKTILRESTETYLKSKQILIRKTENFELPMGEHSYPFSVIIPKEAPPTFDSSHGVISYYINVKFDIPMDCHKKERISFGVINPLDFNLYPDLKIPYKNEKQKTFCCLWCINKPLTMVVHLPKTVFVSSESIPIILEMDNTSNFTVNAIDIYLKREINWIANENHKSQEVVLQKLHLDGLREGQSYTWNENFTLPKVLFPLLACCSVMKIKHELHIEAAVSGLYSNLSIHVPVTIGDVIHKDVNTSAVTPQYIKDEILTLLKEFSNNLDSSSSSSDGISLTGDDDESSSSDSSDKSSKSGSSTRDGSGTEKRSDIKNGSNAENRSGIESESDGKSESDTESSESGSDSESESNDESAESGSDPESGSHNGSVFNLNTRVGSILKCGKRLIKKKNM